MYNFEVLHLGGEGKVRLGAGGFVKLTTLVSDQFSLRSQLNADGQVGLTTRNSAGKARCAWGGDWGLSPTLTQGLAVAWGASYRSCPSGVHHLSLRLLRVHKLLA